MSTGTDDSIQAAAVRVKRGQNPRGRRPTADPKLTAAGGTRECARGLARAAGAAGDRVVSMLWGPEAGRRVYATGADIWNRRPDPADRSAGVGARARGSLHHGHLVREAAILCREPDDVEPRPHAIALDVPAVPLEDVPSGGQHVAHQ